MTAGVRIILVLSAIILMLIGLGEAERLTAQPQQPAVPAQTQTQVSPQSAGARAPQTAEQKYKNIQVLKGIPADQLVPSMQFISASLGVECEFCHVQRAMEKDDKKPKLTARKMMTMMMQINADSFKNEREVTCYTCHRGSVHPGGGPISSADNPAAPPAPEEEPAAATALPSAQAILDKYLAAGGGAAVLQKTTI